MANHQYLEPDTSTRDTAGTGLLSRTERYARLEHWVMSQPDSYEYMPGSLSYEFHTGKSPEEVFAMQEHGRRCFINNIEAREQRVDRGFWECGNQWKWELQPRFPYRFPHIRWMQVARFVFDPELGMYGSYMWDRERDRDLMP